MTTPRLSITGASHSYFGVPVNKNISFDLQPGEVLGLVGENGAGKSTLMNILGGVVRPDSGLFTIDGEPYEPSNTAGAKHRGINFVHQELNLFAELSVVDNLFITGFPKIAGIFTNTSKARTLAKELLASVDLDVSPSTQVGSMSPGQRQLLEFAKGIMGEPRVVILDEPTTSLTHRETTVMFEHIRALKAQGTSFIFVSHILEDVLELCNRIAVLRDGELVGVFDKDEASVALLIENMVGKELNHSRSQRHVPLDAPSALRVENLHVEGQFQDVSFTVAEGEIVGLFGLMGSGRTELAKTIFGETKATSGSVVVKDTHVTSLSTRNRIRRGMAMVTEDRRGEGLLMAFPVVPNAILAAVGLSREKRASLANRRSQLSTTIESTTKLNLKAPDLSDTPVEFLSGGNQQKVVLSKWDIVDPSFLILDEPTRGIDVGARLEVYASIEERATKGAGQLVISSELSELMGIADRILVMRLGRIVGEFAREKFNQREILGTAFGEETQTKRGAGA
jgi:ribose transport system ATP-binding protein